MSFRQRKTKVSPERLRQLAIARRIKKLKSIRRKILRRKRLERLARARRKIRGAR